MSDTSQALDLRTRAEAGLKAAPDFVYAIYIGAPIERVWNALIERDLTKLYWGHHNRSEWTRGARWEHVRTNPGGEVDIVGTVLEIDPPRRLVVSWVGPSNEGNAGKTSRVTYELSEKGEETFELSEEGEETLLRVTHSELEPGSEMQNGISKGWPAVLSNLKTLLETGAPMDLIARWERARDSQ